MTKAELSRRFGVSRRTVHYWIESGQLDRDLSASGTCYSPRPPVTHKLDPYKAIIAARLEEFPRLSAQRLFDEVRAAGYSGAYGWLVSLFPGVCQSRVQHETRGTCVTRRIVGPGLGSRFPGGAFAPTASQWVFRLRYSGRR